MTRGAYVFSTLFLDDEPDDKVLLLVNTLRKMRRKASCDVIGAQELSYIYHERRPKKKIISRFRLKGEKVFKTG